MYADTVEQAQPVSNVCCKIKANQRAVDNNNESSVV